MIPEDKLTDVEKRVLAAFRAGDEFTPDLKGKKVRGDFLRGLFLGEYREKADYRGTCIVGAKINDVLNMEFCETKFPMRFRNCSFGREIKFQQLTCPELDFSSCALEGGIDAESAKMAGSVVLRNGFKAKGAVILAGADIGGQLDCTEGSFQNEGKIALIAQSARVTSGVVLSDGFKAVGMVSLAGAEIGELNCTGGSFQNTKANIPNALNAQSIKVTGSVFLDNGFNAEGEVRLAGADIGGQLNCIGGSFQNEGKIALVAESAKVAAGVVLRGEFKAVGEVSLSVADIGGQLVCAGGSFQNKGGIALNAQGIKVADDLALCDGFKADGIVSLAGAEIQGQLNCMGGSFQNERKIAINARSIKVANEVIIQLANEVITRNFSASGLVSFANAIIGGNFYLENCELTHLSLAGANVLGEFHDNSNIYKDHKGNDITLDIDGFRYQRLGATKEQVKDRLEWVGLMSKGDEFYPQPYEQLMQVYRGAGHTNWARDVGFELEKTRHEKMEWGWWKGWYSALRHTIGYGYRPFRIIKIWLLPAIIGGSLFLGVPCTTWENILAVFAGVANPQKECWYQVPMLPSDAEVLLSENWRNRKDIPPGYTRFVPFFYAVEVALPVLPLGQTEAWHPGNALVKFTQGAITIIEALALTILASYGVGVLGPRWKEG